MEAKKPTSGAEVARALGRRGVGAAEIHNAIASVVGVYGRALEDLLEDLRVARATAELERMQAGTLKGRLEKACDDLGTQERELASLREELTRTREEREDYRRRWELDKPVPLVEEQAKPQAVVLDP